MFLIIRTWTTSALFVFNSSHEWTYFQELEKLHAWYKFIFFQQWIISKTFFSQALLHFFIGCEKFIWKIPISTAASSSPCNHLPLLKCILLPTSFAISATSVKEWVLKARVSGYLQYCRLTRFFQKTLTKFIKFYGNHLAKGKHCSSCPQHYFGQFLLLLPQNQSSGTCFITMHQLPLTIK